MKRLKAEDWHPVGGLALEDNALKIAVSDFNALVVAGPGAGKTELLAQRAAYLLQTNACKYPRKILAISFKKDAAYNLKERVKSRCGDELSGRFDSFTFDGFAKLIFDNFKNALPSDYRINTYNIIFNEQFVLDEYRSLKIDLFNSTQERALLNFHTGFNFSTTNVAGNELIRRQVWQGLLRRTPAVFTFRMIMRAAQHIVAHNPKIKDFLQRTYSYVFLDEFQDTTNLQYELFKTCFLPGDGIFTAVGDDKQRIMLWAGANNKVFDEFSTDTTAQSIALKMNFRSAPRLVKLQNYLVEHLLGKKDFSSAAAHWDEEDGESEIWFYATQEKEKEDLFKQVTRWIQQGTSPRDICILVKQRLPIYAGQIIEYFNANGLKARDESSVQDLITNEVCLFVINVCRALVTKIDAPAKSEIINFLGNIFSSWDDEQMLKIETDFANFIREHKVSLPAKITEDYLNTLIDDIIALAGVDEICAAFASIKNKSELNDLLNNLKKEMWMQCQQNGNLNDTLDSLLGKDTIPVMTIHKSKGLEYHTVVFVGLEDGAFWSFDRQPDEDKSTFFVALSRAKQRVIFTFSYQRDGKNQKFDKIEILLQSLQNSGIAEIIDKTKA